jgi:hypothetical protein
VSFVLGTDHGDQRRLMKCVVSLTSSIMVHTSGYKNTQLLRKRCDVRFTWQRKFRKPSSDLWHHAVLYGWFHSMDRKFRFCNLLCSFQCFWLDIFFDNFLYVGIYHIYAYIYIYIYIYIIWIVKYKQDNINHLKITHTINTVQ